MADIIKSRRDTAANWRTANPTLAEGELGFETDTKRYKLGDGKKAWNDLEYFDRDVDEEPTAGSNNLVTSDSVTAGLYQKGLMRWFNGTMGNWNSDLGITTCLFDVRNIENIIVYSDLQIEAGYKYRITLAVGTDGNNLGKQVHFGIIGGTTTKSITLDSNIYHTFNISDIDKSVYKYAMVGIYKVDSDNKEVKLSLSDFSNHVLICATDFLERGIKDNIEISIVNNGWNKYYITYDSVTKKKIIQPHAGLLHKEIPMDLILSNICLFYPKYKGSDEPVFYYKLIFFDADDNWVYERYSGTNPDSSYGVLIADRKDIPANATQCYIDIPRHSYSEHVVMFNIESGNVLQYINQLFTENIAVNLQDCEYGSIQADGAIAMFKATLITDFIPVTPGCEVSISKPKVVVNGKNGVILPRIVSMVDRNNTNAYMVYNGIAHAAVSGDYTFTVREGYNYIRVSYYLREESLTNVTILADSEDIKPHINGITSKINIQGYILASKYYVNNLFETLRKEIEKQEQTDNIVSLNKETSDIILPQFNKIIRNLVSGTALSYSPFVLLHFSDIHNCGERSLGRIIEYREHYKQYITDVIHTGDCLGANWESDFSYWNKNGAETILNTIGNHDTAHYDTENGFDWTRYVNKPAYDRYIAPFVKNWGVVQPENAEENGCCYYYKDYSACNIRLVVLDDMNATTGKTEQQVWLTSVLNDAKEKNLSVIVAAHFANIYTPLDVQNSFDVYTKKDVAPNNYREKYVTIIDDFISSGGSFVCWLVGHTHSDSFGLVTNTTNRQLQIAVSTAAYMSQPIFDYIDRKINTKSEDLFNIVRVDANNGLISLYRVGADYDSNGKHIGTLCYSYKEHKLLWNS